jgi:serine/threonine-protein kinase
MAPEQIMAAREVDHRADIYALGVLTYEMVAGVPPFRGNAGQVVFAHLQQPPPDPRDLKPNLPVEAVRAIQRAMAKAPEDRFESAGAFAREFSQVAAMAGSPA